MCEICQDTGWVWFQETFAFDGGIEPCDCAIGELEMFADKRLEILRIPTDPIQYAKQLRRLREINNMTLSELATRLGKSEEWVKIHLRVLENGV